MPNTKQNTKPKPSDLLTSGEVAAIARVNVRTVGRWVREGHIPDEAVKRTHGGRYRIFRWAIAEVLN